MKKEIQDYLDQVPEDRLVAFTKLRSTVLDHLPSGFDERINYGMIGYVVPRDRYPGGYHCSPELPLPFASIANRKNFIALYHMGIYANPGLLDWFVNEYSLHSRYKIDMGKSCIRFKKVGDIPYKLIGELMTKMTVENWIELYEKNVKS